MVVVSARSASDYLNVSGEYLVLFEGFQCHPAGAGCTRFRLKAMSGLPRLSGIGGRA
mgnify:FL=1